MEREKARQTKSKIASVLEAQKHYPKSQSASFDTQLHRQLQNHFKILLGLRLLLLISCDTYDYRRGTRCFCNFIIEEGKRTNSIWFLADACLLPVSLSFSNHREIKNIDSRFCAAFKQGSGFVSIPCDERRGEGMFWLL